MELHTKYNTRIFLGVFISLITIIITICLPFSVTSYTAGLFLLIVFVFLTLQKMPCKIIIHNDEFILEYRMFIFKRKQEVYKLHDVDFKMEKGFRYRGEKVKKLVITNKSGKLIEEIEKDYFKHPAELNKLVDAKSNK